MIKNILSEDFYNDQSSQKLVEIIENSVSSLSEATLYYQFPLMRELDEKVQYPSLLIISPNHGVILFKCDGISRARDQEELYALDNDLSRMEELVFSGFIKSQSRILKSGRRNLSFNLSSALYLPNYSDDVSALKLENNVLVSNQDVINFIDSLLSKKIDDSVIIEIYAVIESSTAIIKPKERKLSKEDTTSKAYLLKNLEEEIAIFDEKQKYAALSQLRGPQRIRGLAGSGKTVILCMKAAILHFRYPNSKILYTFMTKSLYDYIELLITRFYKVIGDGKLPDFDNCIHIRHAWGGNNVKGVYYDACKQNSIRPLTFKEANQTAVGTDAFDCACIDLLENSGGVLNRVYDYVLLDEAQDFKPSFYQICRAIVNDDCIVWAYDALQNVFEVKIQDTINTFKNKYGAEGINLAELQKKFPDMQNDIVLPKCYRNPREILVMAHAIGFGIYNDKLIQSLENNSHWKDFGYSVIEGECKSGDHMVIERPRENSPLSISQYEKPEEIIKLYSAEDLDDEITWVCDSIEEAIKVDKLRPDDIIVISLDDRFAKRYFSSLSELLYSRRIYSHNLCEGYYEKGFSEDECVTLTTVYKAKGNESAMVFVIGCDAFNYSKDDIKMRNKAFTAFTRAKAWVRISGIDMEDSFLFNEIIKVANKNFILEFVHKESRVIHRDLAEENAKKNSLRVVFEDFINQAKNKGYSESEIENLIKEFKRSEDGSDKE